jgi:hypothetical protein
MPEKDIKFKRINILIREDQYERVNRTGLNTSGLIRGLLDDHFSDTKITFSMGEETKGLYQNIISNFGAQDSEIEPYFVGALDRYLMDKGKAIEDIRKGIKKENR